MNEEAIFALWQEAMSNAYTLAKGARTAELRGDRRVKGFDQRGLHLYSAEWGRVFACEELFPQLEQLRAAGEKAMDPVIMRSWAQREAEDDFAEDAKKGKIDWHRT